MNKKIIIAVDFDDTITEFKTFFTEHENDMCFILFDKTIKFLISLLKKLEFNDNNFTNEFNYHFIQKLFLYSSNDKIKKIKLLKLLYGLLEINDDYTPDRIFLFLGHPTYVIKENLKLEGLEKIKFGFKLVCGDKIKIGRASCRERV